MSRIRLTFPVLSRFRLGRLFIAAANFVSGSMHKNKYDTELRNLLMNRGAAQTNELKRTHEKWAIFFGAFHRQKSIFSPSNLNDQHQKNKLCSWHKFYMKNLIAVHISWLLNENPALKNFLAIPETTWRINIGIHFMNSAAPHFYIDHLYQNCPLGLWKSRSMYYLFIYVFTVRKRWRNRVLGWSTIFEREQY